MLAPVVRRFLPAGNGDVDLEMLQEARFRLGHRP